MNSRIKRSKVTDYAALTVLSIFSAQQVPECVNFSPDFTVLLLHIAQDY